MADVYEVTPDLLNWVRGDDRGWEFEWVVVGYVNNIWVGTMPLQYAYADSFEQIKALLKSILFGDWFYGRDGGPHHYEIWHVVDEPDWLASEAKPTKEASEAKPTKEASEAKPPFVFGLVLGYPRGIDVPFCPSADF